jgi:hypothetical protein
MYDLLLIPTPSRTPIESIPTGSMGDKDHLRPRN